jgi:hypothetical protein
LIEATVRRRIQRGPCDKETGCDGRVYVYLDLLGDMSEPESQVHRDLPEEELVEEMRDRVALLERAQERRSVGAERYQQIAAGLTQTNNRLSTRLLEQEAPIALSSPSQASEVPAQDVSGASSGGASPVRTREPRSYGQGTQEPSGRSWWRRVFGGDGPCMCI